MAPISSEISDQQRQQARDELALRERAAVDIRAALDRLAEARTATAQAEIAAGTQLRDAQLVLGLRALCAVTGLTPDQVNTLQNRAAAGPSSPPSLPGIQLAPATGRPRWTALHGEHAPA